MPEPLEIVTITLNPAIDETVFLDVLRPGSVNRAAGHHRQPGGKGVNVSVMLGGFGIPSIATGFLGMENQGFFEAVFRDGVIRDEFVRIPGETRTSIKIVSKFASQTTDLNFAGLAVQEHNLKKILKKSKALARPGCVFVIAGSLPGNVSSDFFKRLIDQVKRAGALVVVDTSGAPLKVAIETGADVIKPNLYELEEILGHALPDMESRLAAVRRLQRGGVRDVILSLGDGGALFASPDGLLLTDAPPARVVSTAGAGDALLAGYLAGLVRGLSGEERARLATVFAWSSLEKVERRAPSAEELAERMPRIGVRDASGWQELA